MIHNFLIPHSRKRLWNWVAHTRIGNVWEYPPRPPRGDLLSLLHLSPAPIPPLFVPATFPGSLSSHWKTTLSLSLYLPQDGLKRTLGTRWTWLLALVKSVLNTQKGGGGGKAFNAWPFKLLNGKLYDLFKTQDPVNHTLFSCTYPYRQNKEVPSLTGSNESWP